MTTNDKGLALIKSFESCKLKAYKLTGEAYYTIGWGHSFDKSITADTVWTQKQADDQLKKDLAPREKSVTAMALKHFPHLTENQFAALVSYTYNRGIGGLKELIDHSKTIEDIGKNIVIYWGSADKFKNGLLRRRKAEQTLFNAK